MADMRVNLAGVELKNPVVVASGTFGFGREFAEYFPLENLGGICVKGLTVKRRDGNPSPRIAETPSGILNSVGLQNPGVDAFCEKEMPWLRQQGTKIIANISGNTLEEYADKVILLQSGVLKAGTPAEVLSSPEFQEVFHLSLGRGRG